MGIPKRRISATLVILWLLLTMFISIPVEKTEGATVLPIATLSLEQAVQVADVSPGATGYVEFQGWVECTFNQFTTVVVSLSSTDTWSSSVITPNAVQFSRDSPEPKPFRVSVRAPMGTSANIHGLVTVSGTAVMYPSTLYGSVQPGDGVSGRIDIAPYYKFSVSSDENAIECEPGYETSRELFISNLGNIDDTYQITVSNNDQLSSSGIDVSADPDKIRIRENNQEAVDICFSTHSYVEENHRYDIDLEVVSMDYSEENEGYLYLEYSLELSTTEYRGTKTNDDRRESDTGLEDEEIIYQEDPTLNETEKWFIPGFDFVFVMICILILLIINKKHDRD